MHANPTARAIVHHWQTVLDEDVESGAASLLYAGGGHYSVPNASTLYALQMLAAQRDDPAQPVLVAGGSSAQWPSVLFAPQPLHARPAAAAPVVLFGGEDPATGMACMGVWVGGLTVSPYSRHLQFHYLFEPLLSPRRHPGMTTTWEMLPFVVGSFGLAGQSDPVLAAALPDAETPPTESGETTRLEETTRSDNSGDWIAWATLILALFLPLLAMVL